MGCHPSNTTERERAKSNFTNKLLIDRRRVAFLFIRASVSLRLHELARAVRVGDGDGRPADDAPHAAQGRCAVNSASSGDTQHSRLQTITAGS